MITGLALALLLNQRLPGMLIFRTILFVPTVLSGVAVAVLWVVLLNGDLGAVNQMLRAVGIDDPPELVPRPGLGAAGRRHHEPVGHRRLGHHLAGRPAEHPAAPVRGRWHRRGRRGGRSSAT